MQNPRMQRRRAAGFTFIELLLVLLLVALLASLVAPVVTGTIQRARESALREDLHVLRKGLDDYYGDTGTWPAELEDLANKRYVRRIPVDPITGSRETWVVIRSDRGGVVDLHSGSADRAGDGSYFRDW